jgi:formate/nitrite transporter FocA (FNT family)
MSSWSRPVERRYSKTPLFLSYTKSIIAGSANRTAEKDSKAIEMSGKLFVKSMGAGVFVTGGFIAGIIVIRFERITPYIVRIVPKMM